MNIKFWIPLFDFYTLICTLNNNIRLCTFTLILRSFEHEFSIFISNNKEALPTDI